MATCQLASQSKDQSPLEGLMEQEIPQPSTPWVDPSVPPRSPGRKRKKDQLSDSGEEMAEALAPEAPAIWVVEMLCGFRMKLKRQHVSSVCPEHHEVFARLLEDPVVKRFLAWDKNLRVSDKYLLAMVIAYFSRAGLFSWQYQRIHFFLALYLANDMEEDNQAPKQKIFSFLYGKGFSQRALFHKLRFHFIRSMGWRTWVSREECEEIHTYNPELWVWGRDRAHLPQDWGMPRSEVTGLGKITRPEGDGHLQQEVYSDTVLTLMIARRKGERSPLYK